MNRRPCRDRAEYAAALADPAFAAHWRREQDLARGGFGIFGRLRLPGQCDGCGSAATFVAKRRHLAHGGDVDAGGFRNTLKCRRCGLTARQRLVVATLDGLLPPRAVVYLAEHGTALHRVLAARLGEANVRTSEFVGAHVARGSVQRGVRHEDLEQLTFADAAFDAHVSCDVLEHVFAPERALREAHRVLRPGGWFVATVPFFGDRDASSVRAQRTAAGDGGLVVRHLLPPAYHEDPFSGGRALVCTDFGWDLLDRVRDAGLGDVRLELCWSWEHGWLGAPDHVLVARRPAAAAISS